MSLSKFESEVKLVPQAQQVIYSRFADLNNFAAVKDALNNPEVQQRINEQVPADKIEELKTYAEGLSFETDAIHIASPMGNITLRVVEREEPKCIKFASEGSPSNFMFGFSYCPTVITKPKCVLLWVPK